MSLKVYYDLLSQPSRALIIFLKATKIPFTPCPISLTKGEHLSDEFEKINPFKKLPAIDNNGFKLAESIAIYRYLSREFEIPDNFYPKSSEKRAKVDEYLEWQHLNIRMGGAMFFMTKWLYPKLTGRPVNEKRLQNYEKKVAESLTTIENIFLKNQPYIAGNEISIADIVCACELEQPLTVGYDIFKGNDKIKQWMKTVENDLDPIYTDAHEFIRELGKKHSMNSKM